MIANQTWNGAPESVITNLMCFCKEGPWQVANDLIIVPSKNETVNKNSNKVNNNFKVNNNYSYVIPIINTNTSTFSVRGMVTFAPDVLESRYVSDKHIISGLCMELCAINSDTLIKLWAAMLFKFQWQMLSFWKQLSFGPGFSSISPLSLMRYSHNNDYLSQSGQQWEIQFYLMKW